MRSPVYTSQFKRDVRKAQQRGYAMDQLKEAIEFLLEEKPLPDKYKDHPLKNDWKLYRELHIEPDWLLVYKLRGIDCIFTRTGTHADIFGK